jgi:hypothetical protein
LRTVSPVAYGQQLQQSQVGVDERGRWDGCLVIRDLELAAVEHEISAGGIGVVDEEGARREAEVEGGLAG